MKTLTLQNNNFEDSRWILPLIGFSTYIVFTLLQRIFDIRALNFAGALLSLYILLIGRYKIFLSVKKDKTVILSLYILLLSILIVIINSEFTEIAAVVKHYYTYIFYILIFSYSLSPLYKTKKRNVFYAIILVLFIISLFFGGEIIGSEVIRVRGIFKVPNLFALMSLTILFFINEEENWVRKSFKYSLIAFLLFFSGTIGAILAFAIGLLFKYRRILIKRFYAALPIFLLLIVLFLITDMMQMRIILRVANSFKAIFENFHLIITGEISYGPLVKAYGEDSLSGLWRLSEWYTRLIFYTQSSLKHILFGHGFGSSILIFGKEMHNDFLKVLFEQGLLVFALTMAFLITIFKRITHQYKYVLVTFGIFAITENIIDNVVFINLLLLFMATAQQFNPKSSKSYLQQENENSSGE